MHASAHFARSHREIMSGAARELGIEFALSRSVIGYGPRGIEKLISGSLLHLNAYICNCIYRILGRGRDFPDRGAAAL